MIQRNHQMRQRSRGGSSINALRALQVMGRHLCSCGSVMIRSEGEATAGLSCVGSGLHRAGARWSRVDEPL